MFLQLVNNTDSLLLAKIDKLSADLATVRSEIGGSTWMGIFGIVLGGVLVWLGAYFDRWAQRRKEKAASIETSFVKSEVALIGLRNDLRELSNQRNLSKYWYCNYEKEYDDPNKDATLVQQYYKKCLDANAEAQKLKYAIGKRFCRFFLLASEFNRLTASGDDLTAIRDRITNPDLPDAPALSPTISLQQLTADYTANIASLTRQYLGSISNLDNHLEKMRQKIN